MREGNLQKLYQPINTSYPIRKTWLLYLLLEKKLALASYTKARLVQKWQMFSESDRRGIAYRLTGKACNPQLIRDMAHAPMINSGASVEVMESLNEI